MAHALSNNRFSYRGLAAERTLRAVSVLFCAIFFVFSGENGFGADGDIKVSIVIPNYNTNPILLEKALNSARDQWIEHPGDIEIVCIDDHSTENGSYEFLQKYQAENDNIHICRNAKNRGTLYSRIRGLNLAQGQYMMYLDPDDELLPDIARKAYAAACENEADIVQFNQLLACQNGNVIHIHMLPIGIAEGSAIIEALLQPNPHLTMISGRLYGTDFARIQMEKLANLAEDNCLVFSEDYAQTILFFAGAKKFCGIDEFGYLYNTGIGISSKIFKDRSIGEKYIHNSTALTRHLLTLDLPEKIRDFVIWCRTDDIVFRILMMSPPQKAVELLDEYLCAYPQEACGNIILKMKIRFPDFFTQLSPEMFSEEAAKFVAMAQAFPEWVGQSFFCMANEIDDLIHEYLTLIPGRAAFAMPLNSIICRNFGGKNYQSQIHGMLLGMKKGFAGGRKYGFFVDIAGTVLRAKTRYARRHDANYDHAGYNSYGLNLACSFVAKDESQLLHTFSLIAFDNALDEQFSAPIRLNSKLVGNTSGVRADGSIRLVRLKKCQIEAEVSMGRRRTKLENYPLPVDNGVLIYFSGSNHCCRFHSLGISVQNSPEEDIMAGFRCNVSSKREKDKHLWDDFNRSSRNHSVVASAYVQKNVRKRCHASLQCGARRGKKEMQKYISFGLNFCGG